MYSYGEPVSARFTTIDPIRGGSNWFSYVVNDPVNYVDPFGLESAIKDEIKESLISLKSNFENLFSAEITNETTHELFARAEDNEITKNMLYSKEKDDKGDFIRLENPLTIGTKDSDHNTLTSSIVVFNENQNQIGEAKIPNKISIDSLVLPDGSIYKGWAGSKITVTETKNFDGTTSFNVKQSIGTQIINGVVYLGRGVLNIFRSDKKEYYKYYDAATVNAMENAQKESQGKLNDKSITKHREDKNVPLGYINNKSQTTKHGGCTK